VEESRYATIAICFSSPHPQNAISLVAVLVKVDLHTQWYDELAWSKVKNTNVLAAAVLWKFTLHHRVKQAGLKEQDVSDHILAQKPCYNEHLISSSPKSRYHGNALSRLRLFLQCCR
jgi:hypothetical protein